MPKPDYDQINRRTLLAGVATLEESNASIARSNQIAVETEQIGTEVISDLHGQRETLLRARDRLTNADDDLGRSRHILKKMGHHILYNKIILILIIILEACILGGTVYIKYFKH